MSNVLSAIYTLRSILFQLQSYGFFVRTCKTNLISNYSYCHVHMCAYINQPRATCWDNWLAPIRRWHHAPLPQGVLPSARTTDGAAATACLASKAGIHIHSCYCWTEKPHPIFEENLPYSPILIVWLTVGMKNVCQDETVIILVICCWCIGLDWISPCKGVEVPKVRVHRLCVLDVCSSGMCSQTIRKLLTFRQKR